MELPNIYPYIINDPGEGTQAKRRSYCCILDHLIPVMTGADLYEDLAKLDKLILDYMQAAGMNPTRLPVMQKEVWAAVEEANLHRDLDLTREQALADFEGFMEKLHAYLSEVSDTAIADGLHTFGSPPEGDALVELCSQLVRYKNGDLPSLRESLARHWGYDYDRLLAERGKPDPTGRYATNAQAIAEINLACREIVRSVAEEGLLQGRMKTTPSRRYAVIWTKSSCPTWRL